MARQFRLQDPGEGIHEVTVIEVRVTAGDEVKEGDVLLEIDTDKVTVEVPSPFDGKVVSLEVEDGDEVRVGDTVLTYEPADGADERDDESGEDERPDDDQRKRARAARKEEPREAGESESEDDAEAEGDEDGKDDEERGRRGRKRAPVPATPVARRIARERGVDLHEIEGTGSDGRITAEDVRAAARETRGDGPSGSGARDSQLPDFERWGDVERIKLGGVRRAIARNMARSWREIPHVTHHDVADITELERFRGEHKDRIADQGGRLTLTVIVIKAVVAALREFPRFNASLDLSAGEIVIKGYYHIGVAVQTDRGLVVPVVRDADRKSVRELASELPALVDRVRRNDYQREELEGGTFTVTNPGPVEGGTGFTPIIRPPEAAILGIGRARLEPVIEGDPESFDISPRKRLPLSFAFDHRLNDGADAGRFVRRLIELLATPEKLALNA